MRSVGWWVLSVVGVVGIAAGVTAEFNPVRTHPRGTDLSGNSTDTSAQQVIVKLRETPAAVGAAAGHASVKSQADAMQTARERVVAVAVRTGAALKTARAITANLHVVQVEPAVAGEPPSAMLQRLRADWDVEYADLDQRRYVHANTPNDPSFSQQWYMMQSSATTPSAVDAVTAWDTTTGSLGVVIADLDTGVRFDHPDLLWAGSGGRLLPGYDFITDTFVANDGDGRDDDPSDPGDWITSTDLKQSECSNEKQTSNSSWHGTRTAGILGALSNNSAGIAGMTWNTWLLPVRVLGKCGGSDSDILAAMLWAAGVHVDGVPDNPYPAKIENMSLGATGACPQAYIDVVNQLAGLGVLVVASAGNEGGPVDSPANCPGVVGVGGLRQAGTKVGYSSLGPQLTLSAPAGNCVNSGAGSACLYSIETTFNLGTTGPGTNSYTDQISNPNLGTSFSAPIVSGIAGLMLAGNGNLNTTQLIARLKESAVAFPQTSATTTTVCHAPASSTDLQTNECICTNDNQTCGAGMASASGALTAALRPIAAVRVPAVVTPGSNVTLDAGGSGAACSHTVASYAWVSSDPVAHPVSNPTGATTTVTAPATGTFTVTLTVVDDSGKKDVATITISPTAATTTAPNSAGTTACLPAVAVASPVTVSISPTTASVVAGSGTQTFTATVTKATNTAVNWQVNGVAGGNSSVGTISTAGLYTAPAAVPASGTVTVTAVSAADSTRIASAQVTVTSGTNPSGSSAGSGGKGGGGAMDWLTLMVGGIVVVYVAVGRWSRYPPAARRDALSSQLF